MNQETRYDALQQRHLCGINLESVTQLQGNDQQWLDLGEVRNSTRLNMVLTNDGLSNVTISI